MVKTKPKKKRVIRDRIKTLAAYWTAEKFECTTAFVYASARGLYVTGISGEVKEAYNEKYSQLKKALEA
jgi:hypothetical protein